MARMQSIACVISIFMNILLLTSSRPSSILARKNHQLERRFQGRATWFLPDTGACGDVNSKDDYIVAMNYVQYGGGSPCHKEVVITNKSNNKVVKAKVTDLCPSCGYGSLDLSPAVFKEIGDLDTGVLPITWDWA